MKIITLFLAVCSICSTSLRAETLNNWILSKIQSDEQLWKDAISGAGGHELKLLESSKFYVPFFMELPSGVDSLTGRDATLFGDWKILEDKTLLPGGYILRLRFKSVAPLYTMSAGNWESDAWHSIAIGKDVKIESTDTWEVSNGEYLYATLLAGVWPRLIIYDQNGEVARQESFDASAADFEKQLEAAIAPYSSSEKPVLEMISLAEYLQQPNPLWRAVDTSGQFNLRNQHQLADEQERLKQIRHLTRSAAVSALITDTVTTTQTTPSPKPPSEEQPPAPKTTEAKPAQLSSKEPASSMPWGVILIFIVAAIGLAWLLLKKRK